MAQVSSCSLYNELRVAPEEYPVYTFPQRTLRRWWSELSGYFRFRVNREKEERKEILS